MATSKKKVATKSSKKTAPKRTATGSTSLTIRVRMYRVGFGDCFLVSLPAGRGKGQQHILVDCGVHSRGNINTMTQVVENIAKVTNRSLAIIIATHSHQDHISGFGQFGEQFSGFDIGEVWLPWSENPQDALATKLQRKHATLAAMLEEHFRAQAAMHSPAAMTTERAASAAAVANLVGNQKAMQFLRSGFGVNAQVRYLEAGDNLTAPANIPGLSVRVLGPPRDKKFLAKMDPPEDQRYLRLNLDGGTSIANELRPFASKWMVDQSEAKFSGSVMTPQEEQTLKDTLSNDSLDALAFALDQAKNNTSLVTLFVFRGQYLLFPGDAQYGSWKWWLEREEAEDILPRINFLKVAHHGSHNAMPKSALERMSEGGFAAMVSTQSSPWDSIPRAPLMERLSERAKKRVVRSDWLKIANTPAPLKGAAPPKPARLPAGFSKGAFWYDYLIPLR